MTDDDEGDCELCGGCGEVEATTLRAERETIGCPLCIERDLHAELATVRRENTEAAAAEMREPTSEMIAAFRAWYFEHTGKRIYERNAALAIKSVLAAGSRPLMPAESPREDGNV